MEDSLLQELLKEIKSKKQFEGLEDSFIHKRVCSYFLTHGDIRKKLEQKYIDKPSSISKDKTFKNIVKEIRSELGILYGSFLTAITSKKEKIKEKDLLMLHKSTRERIAFYDEIYEKIFSWYKPKRIIDIACGYNALSLLDKKVEYLGFDLNKDDTQFLNSYFRNNNFNGEVRVQDCTELSYLDEIQENDLVFLFKALDSFEYIKRDISKALLEKIKAKYIVITFPSRSLVSGRLVKLEKRNWLFNFLDKMNYTYEFFEVDNEVIILVKK